MQNSASLTSILKSFKDKGQTSQITQTHNIKQRSIGIAHYEEKIEIGVGNSDIVIKEATLSEGEEARLAAFLYSQYGLLKKEMSNVENEMNRLARLSKNCSTNSDNKKEGFLAKWIDFKLEHVKDMFPHIVLPTIDSKHLLISYRYDDESMNMFKGSQISVFPLSLVNNLKDHAKQPIITIKTQVLS